MSHEVKQSNGSVTLDDLASMVKTGFDDITQRMATKDDLKGMATKEDLGKLRSDMINYIVSRMWD